jgi:hypothetical protein
MVTPVDEVTEPGSSILLGYQHPHETQFGQFFDDLSREFALSAHLIRYRGDLVIGKLTSGLLDHLLFFCEVELHF